MYQNLATGRFRDSYQWDPSLIISQIITIQCILYVTLVVLLSIYNGFFGISESLDQIFSFEVVNIHESLGWIVILAYMTNSVFGAVILWYIIERTKKCLDFSVTWHLIHLIICCFYNQSFPLSLSWWILHICCITIMSVLAEFLCLRTELKPIPIQAMKMTDVDCI